MNELIFYIPFPNPHQGDLYNNGQNVANLPQTNIRTFAINGARVVYGEPNIVMTETDIIAVHAHGGDEDSVLTDNIDNSITAEQTIQRLINMNAHQARMSFFIVCFSAKDDHIARQWKSKYPAKPVYGSYEALQGGIGLQLRRRFLPKIFDDERMELLL